MPILFATQDFDFTNLSFHLLHIIEKWSLYSVVAPTKSVQSRQQADSWLFPAITQGNSCIKEEEVSCLTRQKPGVAAGFLSNLHDKFLFISLV